MKQKDARNNTVHKEQKETMQATLQDMIQGRISKNGEEVEKSHYSEEIIDVYKNYFNTLEPAKELKNKIWRNIIAGEKKQEQKRIPLRIKLQTAALAIICIVLIFAVFGNRITQIKTIQNLMNLCKIDTESDIIRNIIPETEIYAPILWECSEETLIFATARGAVIYSRTAEQIIAVIDLQEIECCYMNTNTIKTRAYMENNQLYIFNEKEESAYGSCYVYTIPAYFDSSAIGEIQKLKPNSTFEADSKHLKKWQEYYKKHYRSIYETMKDRGFYSYKNEEQSSEEIFLWNTTEQTKVQSFLITNRQSRECFLYTCNIDDTEFNETYMELLNVSLTEEELKELKLKDQLPKYTYTGESSVFSSICEYLYNEEKQSIIKFETEYNHSMVWIPSPVIFDIVEEDGEIKVFGNFYSYIYYKSGNTLKCESGGEMPACIHMKKTENGYEVTSMDRAGDGRNYKEDIKKFCKGHPFIRLKYLNHNKVREKAEAMQKEFIKEYVASQGLDIEYYHNYRQDFAALWES